MKILHISSKPVYPVIDGGCAAMASLLRCLENIGEVIHLTVATPKHPFSADAYPTTVRFGIPEAAVLIDTGINPLAALYSLLSGTNYNLRRFESRKFRDSLVSCLQYHQPDVIVLESLFLSSYAEVIRKHSKARIVLRTHNVEHHIWEQQAAGAKGWKKWYLQSLAASLKKTECDRLKQVDEIWTITPNDLTAFSALGISTPTVNIPFAIDPKTEIAASPPDTFFHLGSMNWQPNREAVDLLVKKIWPELRIQPELFIAGSFSEKNDLVAGNIHYAGKVADADEFMRTHGTLVSPVISGSGVRIKVLEALANGAPVITTELGASGIDPDNSGVVTVSLTDFPRAVERIFSDLEQRTMLSAKALAYIGKEHSFAVVTQKIARRIGK